MLPDRSAAGLHDFRNCRMDNILSNCCDQRTRRDAPGELIAGLQLCRSLMQTLMWPHGFVVLGRNYSRLGYLGRISVGSSGRL